MAHFSPTVLAVWEDFSERRLERDLAMLRSHDVVPLGDPTSDAALRRISVRHHEWTHYRQHVTTMVGSFTYRVAFAKMLTAMRIARQLDEDAPLSSVALGRPEQRRRLAATESRDDVEIWMSAHLIGSAFWKKSVPLGMLRRAVARSYDLFHGLPLARSSEVRVVWDGSDQELNSPLGTISVELLSEGLARYREGIILAELLGDARGYEFWRSAATRIGEGTIALIQQTVPVPITHPIVGALHEVALATCPDPASASDSVRFNEVHPGFVFRRMLEALADGTLGFDPSLPVIKHSYDVAERAAGFEHGELGARYGDHAGSLEVDSVPLSVRQHAYREGFRARAEAPWVAAFPEEARSLLDDTTVAHLRPPMIVQPRHTALPARPFGGASFGWNMMMLVWDLLQDGKSLNPARRILHNLPTASQQELWGELRWYLTNLPPHGIHHRIEGLLFHGT